MHRLLLAAAALMLSADTFTFTKEKEIPLPGSSSFDYVTADAASRRLLVAHTPKIEIFDLDKAEKVGTVDGVDGAHGAILVSEQKRGFATAGKKQTLVVFNPDTFKVTKEVPTGEGPDALLYVTTTKEVWTMNHKAGTITCVDASSLEVKATIEVGGALEAAVEDAAKGLVFVNSEDKHFLAVIDAKKHAVTARHPLAPAEKPTGLAIDAKNGILFCGCDRKMAIVDEATGNVIATPEIGSGCDSVAFDAERGLAFASCGDGTTTVVREVDRAKFEVVANIATAKGARTCCLDSKTHRLWVVAGTRGNEDVRLLVFAPDAKK